MDVGDPSRERQAAVSCEGEGLAGRRCVEADVACEREDDEEGDVGVNAAERARGAFCGM